MLVISRKQNEELLLGDNIEIVVLEVLKDRVKIGINAPQNVKIVRKEIYNTELLNKAASAALPQQVISQLLKTNCRKDDNDGCK